MCQRNPPVVVQRFRKELQRSEDRALDFASFLNFLNAPTPAQLWLASAAAQLSAEREPIRAGKRGRNAKLVSRVRERDGDDCWYCGDPCGDDATLEHLQPLSLGGNFDLANLALAHSRCNRAVGALPRAAKEAARKALLEEDARQGNPWGQE